MKKTQKEKVIDQLRTGSVDNFWSINNKVSIRLGAIIFVLRKEGWDIKSMPLGKDKNQVYKLIREPSKHAEAKEKPVEPPSLFGTLERKSTAYERH